MSQEGGRSAASTGPSRAAALRLAAVSREGRRVVAKGCRASLQFRRPCTQQHRPSLCHRQPASRQSSHIRWYASVDKTMRRAPAELATAPAHGSSPTPTHCRAAVAEGRQARPLPKLRALDAVRQSIRAQQPAPCETTGHLCHVQWVHNRQPLSANRTHDKGPPQRSRHLPATNAPSARPLPPQATPAADPPQSASPCALAPVAAAQPPTAPQRTAAARFRSTT